MWCLRFNLHVIRRQASKRLHGTDREMAGNAVGVSPNASASRGGGDLWGKCDGPPVPLMRAAKELFAIARHGGGDGGGALGGVLLHAPHDGAADDGAVGVGLELGEVFGFGDA